MLYDQPQLALTYLSAFQLTGVQSYATVARGILDYLRRDMTHPEGGIFSAQASASWGIVHAYDSSSTDEGSALK